MTHTSVQPLLDFIAASPSCYHAVQALAERLDSDSRRPVLRHPQQLQHPRLSRTPEADRRLHDGRGPQ